MTQARHSVAAVKYDLSTHAVQISQNVPARSANSKLRRLLHCLHWLDTVGSWCWQGHRTVNILIQSFTEVSQWRERRYLSGDCQLIYDASRQLRSSDTFTFAVPRTRTRLGDRSFAVAGPQIWNSLPADLCLVDNYARFRRLLKGHMFG